MSARPSARSPLSAAPLALAAVLVASLGACTIASVPDEGTTLSVAERFYQQRLQDGIDRTARVRRPAPHRLVVYLGSAALGGPRQAVPAGAAGEPAREALLRTVARGAWSGGAATEGDTVVVAIGRPHRLGPLAFGGRTTRDTFVESPVPAATAAAVPGLVPGLAPDVPPAVAP